jgi:hypothetical protein
MVALKQNQANRISDNFALVLGLAIGLGLLRRRGRLMVAESCTGGLAGHWITVIAGSSRWFDGGVISYANAVKQGLLGVQSETLRQQGAVSVETASEMALGVLDQHRRLPSGPVKHIPESLFGYCWPPGRPARQASGYRLFCLGRSAGHSHGAAAFFGG